MDFYTPKSLSSEKNTIISLGNLIPKKRPEFLLEALKIVKNNGFEFTLKVIGEDRLKKHYPYSYEDLLIKHGLTDNVEVCGFVPHERLDTYIRDGFLYINTSIQEGFCLALYEMSLSGLFPIIPRILSFDNVFSERALYYDPNSFQELAEHIMSVMNDKEKYYQYALKNQKFIQETYAYSNIKTHLRSFLLEVAP
jgi:glycosyltransferase involved in cell wall biosynthesis